MAELAASIFSLNGGSVGFEESSEFVDALVSGDTTDLWNRLVGESGEDTFDGRSGHGSGPWPLEAALVSSTEAWTAKVRERINRTILIYVEKCCF